MKDETITTGLIAGVTMIGFLVGLSLGIILSTKTWEQNAVKQGVAEWAHDEHGRPEFKWIRAPKEEDDGER